MTCESGQTRLSVEVPEVGLEIAPHTVDFRREQGKFDYFMANFNEDVGNHIQDSVLDGELGEFQRAYVKIEGKRVYPMIWKPAGVKFNQNGTSVELFDPIHDLQRALVDVTATFTTAREIIQRIFDQYKGGTLANERILNQLHFYPDEKSPREKDVIGLGGTNQMQAIQDEGNVLDGSGIARGTTEFVAEYAPAFFQDGLDIAKHTWESKPKVDYAETSALKAILDMTERVGIELWTEPSSLDPMKLDLWVGTYHTDGVVHHASSDNQGIWRIRDFNISDPQKPIKTLIVKGKAVHDDWMISFDNPIEAVNPWDDIHDYVAQARIQRDIDHGRKVVIESDVGVDSLAAVAEQKFMQIMASETAGDIKINPDLSTRDITDYRLTEVGDKLKTHTPVGSSCSERSQLFENEFIITGVENNIANGNWTLNLDVVDSILNEDIPRAKVWYLDPANDELHDPSDLEEKLTDR